LFATKPIWKVPACVGVPESLSPEKVTPLGSVPEEVIVGVGLPVAVTVKDPGDPTAKVVEDAEVISGAVPTFKVKDWLAPEPTPLAALTVIGKVPPAVGSPDKVAVPSPLSTKLTPFGNVPVSDNAAVGKAEVVTVKLFDEPSANEAELAEVMDGAWSIVRVKDWVALGLTPLEAMMVIGYAPPVDAAGVPDKVAVPLECTTNVTPEGSDPASVMLDTGFPVVVTVKLPEDPTVKVAEDVEVTDGAWSTVKVKVCVALGLTPLLALKVAE
jgi:hypothetical protein